MKTIKGPAIFLAQFAGDDETGPRVIAADPAEGIVIEAASDQVLVREVQPPGSRRMEVADWIKEDERDCGRRGGETLRQTDCRNVPRGVREEGPSSPEKRL